MDEIQQELDEVKARVSGIRGAQLVACVPALVQVKLTRTAHKQLTVCLQFGENYPNTPILMELKSKVLPLRLLDGLVRVCEEEAKKHLGKKQVLIIVKFIKNFIDEHPLCVCHEEIAYIKKELLGPNDEMKLKQKTSQVLLKLNSGRYKKHVRLTIPDDYPISQTEVEITEQNLPDLFKVNVKSQAIEIARRCIQPPIKKNPKGPHFEPTPALTPVAKYLIQDVMHTFMDQVCPYCRETALPADPAQVTNDPQADKYVERCHCKHLYHHKCLDTYMKAPPFTGGKKCLACGERIYHDKWHISPQLAEERWAYKEARDRELSDVVDFLE